MATDATLIADLDGLLGTTLGMTKLSSAFASNLDTIAAGVTAYRLRVNADIQAGQDSNVNYMQSLAEIDVLHMMADPLDESVVQGTLQVVQQTLMSPGTWRMLTSVHSVIAGPEIVTEMERSGNVIAYTAGCNVALKP